MYIIPITCAETADDPETADGGKSPVDMTKSIREFATEWFNEIMLLMCVVVGILYVCGVVSARMVAKGISAAGIVIGAIFIFHALPWLATNLV